MIRIIDLKEYLPLFMTEYKELNKILTVENAEFQKLENEHWKAIDNRYIKTCDLDGIARFEKLLNITPLSNDTLDDRIFRVLAKWNRVLPYNYEYLDEQLKTLCDGNGYSIEMHDLYIKIAVALTSKNMFDDVVKMVNEIVPCNMVTDVILMFNTHCKLGNYPHFVLAYFTHDELRNEELTEWLSDSCDCVAGYTCDEIADSYYTCDSLMEYGIRKVVEN